MEDQQRLRGTMDKESPYSAESQYDSNSQLVKLENEDLMPIIPTPFQVKKERVILLSMKPLQLVLKKGYPMKLNT